MKLNLRINNRTEPNPSGLCLCGCGKKTSLAKCTDISKGWIKNKPIRFFFQHQPVGVRKAHPPPKHNLLGKTFGRWTVIGKAKLIRKIGPHYSRLSYSWPCLCECGNTKFVLASFLIRKTSRSCGCLRKSLLTGNNNHGWKGGITTESKKIRMSIEYRLWREAVFARDSWTCCDCGKIGEKLHPHHIKQFAFFPSLRFAIDNGKTLCIKCHGKIKHDRKTKNKIIA